MTANIGTIGLVHPEHEEDELGPITGVIYHKRPTLCIECDHCMQEGKPWNWRCLKHPRIFREGWVTEDGYDDGNAPYLRCNAVNGGACVLWEPKREAPEEA